MKSNVRSTLALAINKQFVQVIIIINLKLQALTQKLKRESSNVVFLLKLNLAVAHVLKDTLQLLVVVVRVGNVGQGLGEVSLAIRGRVGLAASDVSLKKYQMKPKIRPCYAASV